jgi:dTDP-4-dehydrorhamnose 3,5-epimerase
VFKDSRGYFFESFNQNKFNALIGQEVNFVQDNESFSSKGVLRGLHFQTGDYAQAKLVRAVKGTVLDVVVDMRKESPTFSKHFSIELSEDNKRQLFVPRGFAHGFIVLSETAIFSYKCDNFYNKPSEKGLRYDDPSLAIDWRLPTKEFIVSEKDLVLPTLSNIEL